MYGEDFKFEKRVRYKNGTYRWHLSHSIAQRDSEGKIIAWIGTNTDITEQKSFAEELETKVQERTEELKIKNQTFEAAEIIAKFGSYNWNTHTGALEYSDNLFRLLDCEPQEFTPSIEKFLSFVHPDDVQQVINNGELTAITGKLVETPYRVITKKGITKHFRSSGNFSGEGIKRLLIGTVQDITNDVMAVIVIDDKNIINLWNPKTEEVFGWKAAEVLGLDLTETIIPIQYREKHREGMKRFLKTGESHILNKTLELTALNKTGKEFPISLTISQSTQQGKKLFIAFLRDITFEKRTIELAISNQSLLKANTELEAAKKLTEQLLQQRDEFISIASHEMKTPLTTAKGYIDLLLYSIHAKDQEPYLYASKTSKAIERLTNLVKELSDASKIQNGKLDYNMEVFDINKLLDETIEDMQHGVKSHLIQKTGNSTLQISGDKERLRQVLINLLSNAIKYSPNADKVLVKIEEYKSTIKVAVQDFGVGMSGGHLDKIFDRYYRVQEHAINFQGLGIGLYISNSIIKRHNGTMWVESEPDKGSTFYFRLPL